MNTIIQGDALSVLKGLPDGIVQTCVTSPPYFGLRDYGTETILQLEGDPQDCQHVWIHEGRNEDGAKVAECQHCFAVKVDRQIGLEETPDKYVAKLVEVFREVRRVLRHDGTLWLNLATSYISGIIESEEYVMRDDLTQEEAAYVYSELAKHFVAQSQTMPGVREVNAQAEQDMQGLLQGNTGTSRELCGEEM